MWHGIDRPANNEFGTHDEEHKDTKNEWMSTKHVYRIRNEYHPQGGHAEYFLSNHQTDRCCARLFRGYHHYQCQSTGRHEYRGSMFCKTHLPANLFTKTQARDAKWRKEWDERSQDDKHSKALKEWRDDVLKALQVIAEGNLNDPAGYAQMVLDSKPVHPRGEPE